MSMHIATLHLIEPHEGQTEVHFASIDGESYIGVNRLPETEEDWQAVEHMIAGSDTFKPMTWAARGLRHLAMRNGDAVDFSEVQVR